MNLSMNWLSDFVDVREVPIRDYCERMTATGSKVEGFRALGEDIRNVVVARIVGMEKHPDADRLSVCRVDVGGRTLQIVTGAENVYEGALVPAAVAVARLPGDVTIKPGTLRGVQSDGMLCSMRELGLTERDCPGADPNGILLLDESLADRVGADIREALDLSDTVVEFEITSNRPDCLSVIGLARETAVTFGRSLTLRAPRPTARPGTEPIGRRLQVRVEAPDLCYRYAARLVENVRIAPSPQWMRRRLRAAGVRPVNNIVDITNYVMLEYGQPMHAFDFDRLEGASIRVRRARDGEVLRTLDDQAHALDPSMLVIADAAKPCALAGVMGGADSEIGADTRTIVFESACFLGKSVRATARKLRMRTESSSRFEKELDPENCLPALERACELVGLLGAGDTAEGVVDCYPAPKPETRVPFEPERINRFLGSNLSRDYMAAALQSLGCRVEGDVVVPPSFRGDLVNRSDLAEEIVRLYGYDRIEPTRMNAETTVGGRSPRQAFEAAVERALCGMGLSQICTFSFISPKAYDRVRLPADSPLRRSVRIANPLGEDTSVMRTTALPSLLETLARNRNLSNEDVAFFEIATVYLPSDDPGSLPDERKTIALGLYGDADFYTLKGIVEDLLGFARVRGAAFRACLTDPSYHPGRCAEALTASGARLGVFGQIHPSVAAGYSLDRPAFCGVLDFATLWDAADRSVSYRPLPKYPAVTRDFAFVCPEEMEAGAVEAVVAKAGGKLVERVALFDIYRGESLGAGRKSLAFRVTLRAPDRTLTVEEADRASRKILKDVSFRLGVGLRE